MKKPHPEVVYKCRCCGEEYETLAAFKKACGDIKLVEKHFKVGDIIKKNGSIWKITCIDDTGYVHLHRVPEYIKAFGLEMRRQGGPWAMPMLEFCARSAFKYSPVLAKQQVSLRKKQLAAALKFLDLVATTHMEGAKNVAVFKVKKAAVGRVRKRKVRA